MTDDDLERTSDDTLIAGIAAGRPDALTALFRRRHADVYRFALHMSGTAALADDVTQDVFLIVMRDAPRYEAGRCLSCGNCFECDGCLAACPQDAVIKLGPGNRYRFDYDRCTGCGTCFEQCPVHAIEMVPEATP